MNIKLLFFPFSLIILVWTFVSYTKPGWDQYNKQKKELETLLEKKAEIVAGVNKVKKASKDFQGISDESKSFVYNAVPVDINNDDLIGEINKDASQAGVLVTKISVKKSKNKNRNSCRKKKSSSKSEATDCAPEAMTMGVNLMAVGSYPMIKDFIAKLDGQNRLISPIAFSLTAAKGKKGEEEGDGENSGVKLITAKIDFEVYFKERNDTVVLSKAMENDRILKSLLNKGLNVKALEKLNTFVTSSLFYPVQAEGMGKENLFE